MLCCAGIAGFFSSSLHAQSRLGLSIDEPVSPVQLSERLNEYERLGIQYLELRHPVAPAVLDTLGSYPFEVLIRTSAEFLTASTLEEIRGNLASEYLDILLYYSEYEFVQSIGLYTYSQSFNPGFAEDVALLTSDLSASTSRSFYEVTTTGVSALELAILETKSEDIPENFPSVLYTKPFTNNDFRDLASILDKNPTLLFLDSKWLDDARENHPEFETALTEYQQTGAFVLPFPKPEPAPLSFNWGILVFILIWVSMGVHFKVVPTYPPLIYRYFTGHRFFVDDIMRYRERSVASGLFLFFQHAAFTGLVVSIFSKACISETGLTAFYEYVPQLAFFGKNYFSLFTAGMLLGLVVEVIGLIWLFFPSKSMTHFSQALSLYTWIFHLDFIFVSILLVLQLTGGSEILITIICSLFVLNWLTGFLLTSFDSSKYMAEGRASYIIYTFGLHSIVNIGLLILIFSSDSAIDLIELVTTI